MIIKLRSCDLKNYVNILNLPVLKFLFSFSYLKLRHRYSTDELLIIKLLLLSVSFIFISLDAQFCLLKARNKVLVMFFLVIFKRSTVSRTKLFVQGYSMVRVKLRNNHVKAV